MEPQVPDARVARGVRSRFQPRVVVHPDAESLALAVATLFVEKARRAVKARGRFTVALAGGSTPKAAYRLLARPPLADLVPWGDVHVFWGDERCVDPNDLRSNERMAREALLDHVSVPPDHVHPMRCATTEIVGANGVGVPPDELAYKAAGDYERLLRNFFSDVGQESSGVSAPRARGDAALDLVLLGLGDNGHTASLFPGSDALQPTDRWVVAAFVEAEAGAGTTAAGEDLWRVTLTASFINRAESVVFVASGPAKAPIVAEVLEGRVDPVRLPAQLIRPRSGSLLWHLDEESAAFVRGRSLI